MRPLASVIDGFSVILSCFAVHFSVLFAQLVGYTYLFMAEIPSFGDEDLKKEVTVIFIYCALWHFLVGTVKALQLPQFGEKLGMKWNTPLMIIQVMFLAFIIDKWVFRIGGDVTGMTDSEKLFLAWIWIEVSIPLASILGCAIQSLFILLQKSYPHMILKEMEVVSDVDDFNGRNSLWFDLGTTLFTPGMTGIMLLQEIEDDTLRFFIMLTAIAYLLDTLVYIQWAREGAHFMVENRATCSGKLWLLYFVMLFVVFPLVIVTLGVATFITDKDNTMLPYTVYAFFLPIFQVVGCALVPKARRDIMSIYIYITGKKMEGQAGPFEEPAEEGVDHYKNFMTQWHASCQNKLNRSFIQLVLREDLYAWTFLGTLSREHIVQVMWLSKLKQQTEEENEMKIKKTVAIHSFEEAQARLDEATEEVHKARRIQASTQPDMAALSQRMTMAQYQFDCAEKTLKDIAEIPDKNDVDGFSDFANQYLWDLNKFEEDDAKIAKANKTETEKSGLQDPLLLEHKEDDEQKAKPEDWWHDYNSWSDDRRWLSRLNNHRGGMYAKQYFLILAQLGTLFVLAAEGFHGDRDLVAQYAEPKSDSVILVRFLCIALAHISLSGEYKQAFELQKYALNHPWKFTSWSQAFQVGLTQYCIVFLVECINQGILMSTDTVMDTLMNFVALAVIAEFDDFLYMQQAVNQSLWGRLITDGQVDIDGTTVSLEDLVKVEATSGKNCDVEPFEELAKNEKGEELIYRKHPRRARVEFSDRTCGNKFYRVLYLLCKRFYQIVWFYFAPFIGLFATFFIPYALGGYDVEEE